MATPQTARPNLQKPLRLWPGVAIVILQWLAMYGLPVVVPEARIVGILTGLFCGLLIVVWWAFFSRASRVDRFGAVVLMILALVGTSRILHVSMATGAMGMLFLLLAIPVLSLAFVAWALLSRHLAAGPRRATMVATIVLACGAWALVRTGGFTGEGDNDFAWRWSATAEERLLAQAADEPLAALPPAPPAASPEAPPATPEEAPPPAAPEPAPAMAPAAAAAPASSEAGADWPGFRGPGRDSVVRGVQLATDWAASPPRELWRRPIGPGWSSFAVHGDLFYTQEQRGDDEVVACYRLTTGEPVWMHRDAARFWESNGGAGPRGTPTLSGGRVFSFGATGILNALDARDGAVRWSRNAAEDTGAKLPGWGFSSSPLVLGDLVIVATSGILAAYDFATGEPRWTGPTHGGGYSSPHQLTIDGVPQILLMNREGATSLAPADGSLLWEYSWSGAPIVQPARIADGDLLLSTSDAGGALGIRRLAVAHGPGGWTLEERWTSRGLKPYFNDFVVHRGHAFGFDGFILAAIDLADGQRKWKGGRYGNGQLLLLPDQDLLLVLSEQGGLALVAASADQYTEFAKFPAIEGKTWNHPVLIGDLLLVRNSEEMAAFRLPLAGSP